MINFANKKLPDNFKFGVEIECGKNSVANENGIYDNEEFQKLGYKQIQSILKKNYINSIYHKQFNENFKKNNNWIIGKDGSLGYDFKLELKSPILVGEKGLQQLIHVMNILKEAKYKHNNTCGFHVHVNVSNYTLTEIKKIIEFFVIFENAINKYLPKHRTDNKYCKWLNNKINSKCVLDKIIEIENKNTKKSLMNLFPERHTKINVQNITNKEKNTIEFRQHHMTFNEIEISSWIRFIGFVFSRIKNKSFLEKISNTNFIKRNCTSEDIKHAAA